MSLFAWNGEHDMYGDGRFFLAGLSIESLVGFKLWDIKCASGTLVVEKGAKKEAVTREWVAFNDRSKNNLVEWVVLRKLEMDGSHHFGIGSVLCHDDDYALNQSLSKLISKLLSDYVARTPQLALDFSSD